MGPNILESGRGSKLRKSRSCGLSARGGKGRGARREKGRRKQEGDGQKKIIPFSEIVP
jgi:hypothetical protein